MLPFHEERPKMSHRKRFVAALLTAGLTSCSGSTPAPVLPAPGAVPQNRQSQQLRANQSDPLASLPTPIAHVVIIIQENRTPDYLFQGIPNADISKYAVDSHGDRVALHEVSLSAPYDLIHTHKAFLKDFDDGEMDGFDAGLRKADRLRPFGFAPESEVRPYHDMARQYALADHMFEGNEGPSFPAHLYLVSGTATEPSIAQYRVSGNPSGIKHGHSKGGCDSKPGTVVATIAIESGIAGPSLFPCFDRPVLTDFLDQKNVSWRYYQNGPGAGLWHPFDAIQHVRYGKDYANVITRSQQVLTDIHNGELAGLTWIAPADSWSDHASKHGTAKGPSWVAAVVNAIGESRYWNSTAIFVVWDDWGGWYDHVPPPLYNAYELGFRVPLLIISPYVRRGYVSKPQHEFGSLLAFSEETFGIPKGSLDATDVRADDLKDPFDFSQRPRAFVPIKAPPFKPGSSQGFDQEDP
ncbi:MAG: alkaline phosphatase family protein [Candidatus Cybelea sp.]